MTTGANALEWPRTWIAWLRWLAVASYLFTGVYTFFRPTAEEYLHANGVRFGTDLQSGNISTIITGLGRALLVHLSSFSASVFFSFLLFSIGFVMIYWMLSTDPNLDTLVRHWGPKGYARAALVTLLSTIVIVAAGAPQVGDKEGVAAILVALAVGVIIILYGWNRWGDTFDSPPAQSSVTSAG